MSEVIFGRLTDLLPREAWKHEAIAFTPWLAENIDQLSEVIGVPLELTGTEMAVESFSADILARNTEDGTIVLIENQLEVTDHTHLGQIMTYLAGLEAQTVIWIAPRFRGAASVGHTLAQRTHRRRLLLLRGSPASGAYRR